MSVLEDQNRTLSVHLVEKKGNIPDSDDGDLYAIYMQGLRILLMLRKKEDMENASDKNNFWMVIGISYFIYPMLYTMISLYVLKRNFLI